MPAYQQTAPALLEELQVNPKEGLSSSEAEKRLFIYGNNAIRESKKKNNLQRFFEQFKDVMILVLIAAAAISFALTLYHKENFYEPVLIILIVVINAVLGTVQENKAEKALEALKQLSLPQAKVRRESRPALVEADKLVPGDIILLEAGAYVPADGRLISSYNFKTEEASLTGEVVPAEKEADITIVADTPLADRHNMVYAGSGVASGRAEAVVTATGMQTELGKIAHLLEQEEEGQTPLQYKLARLGKYLALTALIACAVIFVLGLLAGLPVAEIFITAVALAVSAIPEGLPAIITVVLALGVQRMVKQKAIIRRLPAVETLGSASVICTDKTGTLTENKMRLTHLYTAGSPQPEEAGAARSEAAKNLLLLATLCGDGSIITENGAEKHLGDPTETAIIAAAQNYGLLKEELEEKYPRLAEIPFDAERKLMCTVNNIEGRLTVIVKGAPGDLFRRCLKGDLVSAHKFTTLMSEQALRVLAVGFKVIDELPEKLKSADLENGLTFLGLLGLIDPPRPEARQAVLTCLKAGIKPVMITGDHLLTATAIAKETGILKEGDRTLSSIELQKMSDEEFQKVVSQVAVYARATPDDKMRIVKAWQSTSAVVAMTGDGVNDAPALKAADIGCAMGITGTDVAKGAADMILTDDNFATIVAAVREGRGIYNNIKKVVGFLLGTNIGELLSVFLAMSIWRLSPLLSVQLLWINLVTDSFPALALGVEPVESSVMEENPRPREESIFAGGFAFRIIMQGLLFTLLTLVAFRLGLRAGGILSGRTMAFIVLALTQVFHAFNMRSEHSLFKTGLLSNKALLLAALLSFSLVALVVFVPALSFVFGLAALSFEMYLVALLLALAPLPVLEATKLLRHLKQKTKKQGQAKLPLS